MPIALFAADATLDVRDAWVEPAARGRTSHLHATFLNTTSATLSLNGFTSPLAGRVLMTRFVKTSGDLVSQHDIDMLDILPQQALLVTPDVLDIRLIDVTTDLEEGNDIALTFALNGVTYTLRVPVGDPMTSTRMKRGL